MEILAFLELAAEHDAPCIHHRPSESSPSSPLWGWWLKSRRSSRIGAIALLVLTANVLGHILWATVAQARLLSPGQVLQQGDQSSLVQQLQQRLRETGFFNAEATGLYGSITEEAVRRYQQSVGLSPDGIYGSATDNALFGFSTPQRTSAGTSGGSNLQLGDRTLNRGDQGSDVSELQQLLNERVAFTNIDGDFGSATETRVIQFQRFRGLNADGVVGPTTLAALRAQTPGQISVPSSGSTSTVTDSSISQTARAANTRAARINAGPYRVIIPTDSDNEALLIRIRSGQFDRRVPNACMARSRRGGFIFAGGYQTFGEAESARLSLRSRRQTNDPDSPRIDARIDYKRGDFRSLRCLY